MSTLDSDVDPVRQRLWGLIAAAWAIAAVLLAGSLGVPGLGLNVLADVAGSIGLVWPFGMERRDPRRGIWAEARASIVVATVFATAFAAGAGLVHRTASAPLSRRDGRGRPSGSPWRERRARPVACQVSRPPVDGELASQSMV